MKLIMKLIGMLVLTFLISACASGPYQDSDATIQRETVQEAVHKHLDQTSGLL